MDRQKEIPTIPQPQAAIRKKNVCPQCKCRTVTFFAKRRRALFFKFFEILLSLILAFMLIFAIEGYGDSLLEATESTKLELSLKDEDDEAEQAEHARQNVAIAYFSIFLIGLAICKVFRYRIENKTDSYAICQECGHQWEIL